MIYQWKNGAHKKGDVQAIGQRLERLRKQHDGKLYPRDVVVDARPDSSPMHHLFEWDDRKAAFEHRLTQARELIRSVVVVMDHMPEPVRQYVCVKYDGDEEQCYTSTESAVRDPTTREQVLARAKGDLAAWVKRYRTFTELAGITDRVEQLLVEFPSAEIEEAAA